MANIFLIRHTKVNNPQNVCYGHSEIDLAPTFSEERKSIVKKIDVKHFDQVYSSPSERALKLAKSLSGSNLFIDENLRELHFGDWENKPWDAIPEKEITPWMNDFVNVKTTNGESYTMLFERVKLFWQTLKVNPDENIAIVTHSGVIRSLLCYFLDIPLQKSFNLQLDYGSVTKIIQKDVAPVVSFINR